MDLCEEDCSIIDQKRHIQESSLNKVSFQRKWTHKQQNKSKNPIIDQLLKTI